jgi:hypothetical protein
MTRVETNARRLMRLKQGSQYLSLSCWSAGLPKPRFARGECKCRAMSAAQCPGYKESEWADCGRGNRMKLREPICPQEETHGIEADDVTK